jgi:outer membrane protein OmpU
MNNFKKAGLTALAGSLAMVSANAVDTTITMESQGVFSSAQGNENASEASNGKGFGVDTDVHIKASGELDMGWTVSVAHVLDTNAAVANSSTQMAVGMGSYGTFQFNHLGGAASNGIDDVLPFAYEEPWDATPGTNEGNIFGAAVNKGSVTYKTPSFALPLGLTISGAADYDPQANVVGASAGSVGADGSSGEAFVVTLAHESGLTLGGGNMKVGNTDSTKGEQAATGYAKYANGGLTVAYQEFYYNNSIGEKTSTTTRGVDTDGSGYALAYTAGDLTLSYSKMNEQTNANGVTAALEEEELTALQAAYSMGGMTLAASLYESDNIEGVAGVKYEETELSVSFAF